MENIAIHKIVFNKSMPQEEKDAITKKWLTEEHPKEHFVKLQTVNRNGNKLYFGQLKPGLKGSGLWDSIKNISKGVVGFIKDPIGNIVHSFGPVTGLNNVSTETLKKFGNEQITSIQIARTPLHGAITGALDVLSLGTFKQEADKQGLDKLFHLSLVISIKSGQKIIVEKNEVININTALGTLNDKTEYMQVNLQGKTLTLNEMIDKTKQRMGNNFYSYDAFKNNCQNFLDNILEANGLNTPEYKKFLLQDITGLSNNLPSYISPLTKGITQLGSIWSRIRGSGKPPKGFEIQSVIFPIESYTKAQASKWLKKHDIKQMKPVHTTDDYHRYRIREPEEFKKFRTIDVSDGIKFILGKV